MTTTQQADTLTYDDGTEVRPTKTERQADHRKARRNYRIRDLYTGESL